MNGDSNSARRRYYPMKQVSEILGVDESTVRRWTQSGKLKCFRTLGGHRRFPAAYILEFLETFRYDVESAAGDRIPWINASQIPASDFLLLKEDYHTLCEVYFAAALSANTENMTNLLIQCSSKAEIPLAIIYDEIIAKAINKIKNLGRQRKLDHDKQHGAINAILESFIRSRDVLCSSAHQ